MKRQIPLHVPQKFPKDWDQLLLSAPQIPTEEQLNRADHMDDDFYTTRVRIGMDTRALVFAAMHAFSTTTVPELSYVGGGGFNEVFALRFPDTGFKIVARFPRKTQHASGRMESVVAVMTMARCHASIPAPEVYAWQSDENNLVGAPYMLLEWVEGVEPWEQWYNLSAKDRTAFLDELALQHAKFAKPLPFEGLGSLFFAEFPAESDVEVSLEDPSTYRIGPFCPGEACTHHRGLLSWPQTIPRSLPEFWMNLWQHEADEMTKTLGSARDAVIATSEYPSPLVQETITVGQFLDVAEAIRILIRDCASSLPPTSQSDLYQLSFTNTDYAFRNIKMDPQTRKITSFIDWDDIYVMPFLLCSRYPEDICYIDGSGERWHKTGGFMFLPLDEEGDIEEDIEPETAEEETPEESDEEVDENEGDDNDSPSGDENSEDGEEDEENMDEPPTVDDDIPEHNPEDYDRPRRIKDTRLRRQYEQLLTVHDSRFGTDRFWEMRAEPLKLQHLLTHGWVEWMAKEDWVKARAAEIQFQKP